MDPRLARATVVAAVLVALAAPAAAGAATFTVVSNDDVFDGTCPTPDACNLRQAINSANATPGTDRIVFEIGAGPQTITLTRPLPPIFESTQIDATTQPGYSGEPIVEVNGTLGSGGNGGLEFVRGSNLVQGLVLNRFAAVAAIFVRGASGGSAGNVFRNNYIGTDMTGTVALPNRTGIALSETERNLIGGRTERDRNVISGNADAQVRITFGDGGNVIEGNYIGVDATGSRGLGGQFGVMTVNAPSTTIGGGEPNARNVISLGDGSQYGIWLFGPGSRDALIASNFIGTDATGTRRIGNHFGISLDAAVHTVIGAPSASGGGNVVSGNQAGIVAFQGTENAVVRGNLIGTDVTGTAPIPNAIAGIILQGRDHEIGGIGGGERNVISGNGSGVVLGAPENVRIENNYIGVDVTRAPLPNANAGIEINTATGTLIGGTGPGTSNVIAYNGAEGIMADGGLANAVLGNSIHSNGRLGIDLFPPRGVTPNDPGDADVGANELQNFPELTVDENRQIQGVLRSKPSTTYRIQFYANAACDPSGFGEGERFIGEVFVTTDPLGVATFQHAGSAGAAITTTATDPLGNTSEFSNCAVPPQEPPNQPAVVTLDPPVAENPVDTSHTVTATVSGSSGTPVEGVTVRFTVTGSSSVEGSCTTDENGQCSFTYQGPADPGADVIEAFADTDGDGEQDPGEPGSFALKAWLLPASTPGQVTGGGTILNPTLTGRVVFGFNAQFLHGVMRGHCDVVDRDADVHVKCLTVTSLVITGTHATFRGEATVNGVATTYRIDVDDLGEPGLARDTFTIAAGGYVRTGVLVSGNIQIHP